MSAGRVAAVLLLVTAALFSVGVAVERRGGATHEATEQQTTDHEAAERRSGAPTDESGEPTARDQGDDEAKEAVLGVDLESPWTVAAAITISAVLAVGLWWSSRRWLAVVAALFAVMFAALDIDELIHQLTENRAGLVALAVLLAVGHLVAGALAGGSTRRQGSARPRMSGPLASTSPRS